MKFQRSLIAAFGSAVFLVYGCEKSGVSSPPPAPTPTNAPARFMATNAQPKLPTMKLYLGAQEVNAEIAMSLQQVMTGMMFRKEMGENEGMLFVFSRGHRPSFYMKNTLIPLSCAYIDPEGTILEIYDMKPLDETSIEAKSDNIQYVLEMKQGWFERNKVATGSIVRTERGSLAQAFFGRK